MPPVVRPSRPRRACRRIRNGLVIPIKKTGGALKVNRIRRGEETHIVPLPDAILRAGDQLVVRDTPTNLKEFERVLDAHLYAGDLPVDEEHPLTADDQQLAELVVIQGSPVNGR